MRFFVGTSGYSYKEWKGSFYPEKLPQREMLAYYAARFSTCEINNTFYRMPQAGVLEAWASQVPADFRFVLKAPQTITHFRRLKGTSRPTDQFFRTASVLKKRLGPLLFQLPPNFKKDLPRLERFLGRIKNRGATAFEFRHESWLTDDVFDSLRKNGCTLCAADAAELPPARLVKTARSALLRLRRERYSKAQLAAWIDRLKSLGCVEAYVFFKHEDTGTGPKLARRFLELLNT